MLCFAAANLYTQPLIEERGYAWVTSSKVPGGCGKGPASECGLSHLDNLGTDFLVVLFATFFSFRSRKITCVNSACDKKGTHKCNLPLISLVKDCVCVCVFVEVK